MRVIDLLKDVMKEDLSNLQIDKPKKGYTLVSGLCFKYANANEFAIFVDLIGETNILQIVPKNSSRAFYSIGIGTNKLKGWYLSPSKSLISIDLRDFSNIDQDESYLVLKYGKVLLEEVEE